MTSGIYEIFNQSNGKRYVGSATNFQRRWATHLKSLRECRHHSLALQRAWDRYGESSFVFRVLEIVSEKGSLIAREQHWIDEIAPEYNIAKMAGSSLGIKRGAATKERLRTAWTPERREKQSARMAARVSGPQSEVHRRRISEANTGKERTSAHRARLSAALGGYPVRGECIETGDVITVPYVSAVRALGFHADHVRDCANGKRKTHKGFRWTRL